MIWREGTSSIGITEVEQQQPKYLISEFSTFNFFEDKAVAGLQCLFHSEVKGNTKAVIDDSFHKEQSSRGVVSKQCLQQQWKLPFRGESMSH